MRFIEHTFGVTGLIPRPFAEITAIKDADFFINDKTPPTDPDDD